MKSHLPVLTLALCLSIAQAGVHTANLTFRPSQFHSESAAVASDTGAIEGTVPRSASTRGTFPVFAGSIPRYDVALAFGSYVGVRAT